MPRASPVRPIDRLSLRVPAIKTRAFQLGSRDENGNPTRIITSEEVTAA